MPFPRIALLALLACACEPDKDSPPVGGDDTAPPETLPECPTSWWTEWDEGVQLQASGCLAWSPRAEDAMDWFSAVGPEDAVAGGCGSYCSDEPGYCDELDLAGITSWRLPSKAELEAAGSGEPPLEPLDEALWSRDSLPAAEDMAYQVVLDTTELDFMQGKDQAGWVRCVADL
jgi:hypothetical protein